MCKSLQKGNKMGTLHIEVDEKMVTKLVREYIINDVGIDLVEDSDITIEVKSKQNYRSEWEKAAFRAVVNKIL